MIVTIDRSTCFRIIPIILLQRREKEMNGEEKEEWKINKKEGKQESPLATRTHALAAPKEPKHHGGKTKPPLEAAQSKPGPVARQASAGGFGELWDSSAVDHTRLGGCLPSPARPV